MVPVLRSQYSMKSYFITPFFLNKKFIIEFYDNLIIFP